MLFTLLQSQIFILNKSKWFSFFLGDRLSDWLKDVDARVHYGITYGKAKGFIKSGDPVVVVTGWKQGSGFTNTLRIVYVSDIVENIVY